MTDIRVLRFDANGDGTIDISSGDKVYLYFGLRRGGPYYYALDVTSRGRPGVLWKIGATELPGLANAWSTPTLARVRIAAASQNGEHFVLIFGGGYDEAAPFAGAATGASGTPQESPATAASRSADPSDSASVATAAASDAASAAAVRGNRIFIIDAVSGRLLWRTGADLQLAAMVFPIPARINALDTDADGYADRLYTVDWAGQVWRVDIQNGRSREQLATGAVLADLRTSGTASSAQGRASGRAASDASSGASGANAGTRARHFFNAPDVTLIQHRGSAPYYNLAFGSGDADLRAASSVIDRFYSLRDYNPFTRMARSSRSSAAPITEADLVDISASAAEPRIPAGSPGWKLDLATSGAHLNEQRENGQRESNGHGERVVAESITANGVILFTTFAPGSASSGCAVSGTARAYAVSVDTATAALDLNDDQQLTPSDLSVPLAQTTVPTTPTVSIATTSVVRISGPAQPSPVDGSSTQPDANTLLPTTRCAVGAEALSHCVRLGTLTRTFWYRRGVR